MGKEEMDNVVYHRIEQLMGTMSQKDFADSIGTVQSNISRIKNGAPPSAGLLLAIADQYNVSVDWLLGRTEEEKVVTAPRGSSTTYADVMTILDILFKRNTIETKVDENGKEITSEIVINDKALQYLLLNYSLLRDGSTEVKEARMQSVSDTFSETRVVKWDNKSERIFAEAIPGRANDQLVVRAIQRIRNGGFEPVPVYRETAKSVRVLKNGSWEKE